MKLKIQLDVVEKMFQPTSSNKLLISAIKLLIPEKKQKIRCIFTIIFSVVPSVLIALSNDTIIILLTCVQSINDVILALFGIIFTGYALFQALIGKEMLIRMLENTVIKKDGSKISKLQESNELFASTMMLNLICIIVNVMLILILSSVSPEAILFDKLWINNLTAGLGIFLYFYIIFSVLIEMKSFIFNIVELFSFHAGTKMMEIIQEDNEKK